MAIIKIFTGPTCSGKTTRLMQWASSQKRIDAIFQPVIDDKRFIYHLSSRTLKLLESSELTPKHSVVEIGKYKFNCDVFTWAKEILLKSFNADLEYMIIDEIGRLELNGKGLEPVIGEITNNHKKFKGSIVFVVRDSLFEKFVKRFNLQNNFETLEIE